MRQQPQKSNILDKVLLDHKKISEAPSFVEDHEMEMERKRLYKAIDNDGDIYLIANPAAWRRTEKDGSATRYRPKPQLVLNAKDAQKTADSNNFTPSRSVTGDIKELGF